MLKVFNREPIRELYIEGLSSQEIKDVLKLNISVRQIQRIIKEMGVSRTIGDAFRNAVKRDRVHFAYVKDKVKRLTLSPKLRYQVLERDGFKCVKCGSNNVLEVDHIDEDKNHSVIENLQTLCHQCNQGKSLVHRFK